MRYSFKQFQKEYPNDDVCLDVIFQNQHSKLKFCPKCAAETKFYRVKNRKCYVCKWCSYQIYPLANTIFHNSPTPLTDWFHAIYLFSVAKNGISAKELERHLGVTYKTAWRMAKQIRLLMQQNDEKLTGIVEADEMMFGGKALAKKKYHNKTMVFGAVEKGGKAKVQLTDWASTARAKSFIRANLEANIELHTDKSRIYVWSDKEFNHSTINHSKRNWADGDTHINTIEGLWSHIQNSVYGTYKCISPKYLQSYLNEFVFRYNYRDQIICPILLTKAAKPIRSIV